MQNWTDGQKDKLLKNRQMNSLQTDDTSAGILTDRYTLINNK
jgi:hypothetical protein